MFSSIFPSPQKADKKLRFYASAATGGLGERVGWLKSNSDGKIFRRRRSRLGERVGWLNNNSDGENILPPQVEAGSEGWLVK